MKKYQFNTWEVYPVVDHFQRKFKSIWKRFSNVMGHLPKLMRDLAVMEDLKKLRDDLDKDFVINVFGSTDIERKDIVMDKHLGETMSDSERTVGLTVDLIVVRCEGSDKTELMRELRKHLVEVSSNGQSEIVVFYETETDLSGSTEEDIKLQIKDVLQKAYLDCHNIFIVKGSVKDELGMKLSEVFERRVAEGFMSVRSDLRRFVQTNAPKSATVDKAKLLIETESSVRAIKNFLYTPLPAIDFVAVEKVSYAEDSEQVQKECISVGVREQTVTLEHGQKSASEAKKSNLVEEEYSKYIYVSGSAKVGGCSDIAVKALSKMIRCAAAEPLAVKFQLPLWVINGMLIRMDFKAKLACCLSKNTRYHLGKLFVNECRKHKFGLILYQIQNDYLDSKVETDLKTLLSAMKRLTDVMKKMVLEVNAHLQQTVLKEENPIRDNKEKRMRYHDMWREILELDGIFRLGTVFDQLEIHFERSDKINVDTLKTRVEDIMKKHHYFNGCCIKEVITPSKAYARHYFEQGDIVSCPFPNMDKFRNGTLGGFACDKDGKAVYGLTCAHVVNPFDSDRLPVCIQQTEHQRRKPFARSTPQAVMMNMPDLPFVDIAAVELKMSFDDNYDFDFKNEKKQSKPAVLADETPQPGTHVYKFGAITGLTEGIISLQTELEQFEDNNIILIEHLPGIPADIPSAIGNFGETEPIIVNKRQSETNIHMENRDSGVQLSDPQPYLANNDLAGQTKLHTDLDLHTHKNNVEHADLSRAVHQALFVDFMKDQPDRRSETDAENVQDDSGVGFVQYDGGEAKHAEYVEESKGRQTDSNGLTRDDKNECSVRSPYPEIADEENESNSEFGNQIDPQQQSAKFAAPGDSGAIVCSFDPKSDTVTAIAMFRGGDMTFKTAGESTQDSVYCSFLLKKGLQELGKQLKNDPDYFKLDVARRRQRFLDAQK